MATRFHSNEILDAVIDLIDTNLSTPMGLKTIAKGDCSFYMGPDDTYSTHLPAVFVKAAPTTDMEFVLTGQGYEVVHRLRIVYVRQFEPGDLVIDDKVSDTVQIAELFIDNMLLGASLSNGQIIHSIPRTIEWEPVEDSFVAELNLDFHASAVLLDVTVRTRK